MTFFAHEWFLTSLKNFNFTFIHAKGKASWPVIHYGLVKLTLYRHDKWFIENQIGFYFYLILITTHDYNFQAENCHKNYGGKKMPSKSFLGCGQLWSSDSHQAVVRQSSDSHQAVIRQSSGSHQTAVNKASGSHQVVNRKSTRQSARQSALQ